MHPLLFEIGPFSIRYYGLMYVLGIIAAIFLIRAEVRRRRLPLTEDEQVNFILLTVFAGIIVSRIYYVAFNWPYYRLTLWEIPAVWHGGLAIHGGVLGGICSTLWYARWKKIPFLRLTDLLSPPLILGQAFGRFGNFMNGDAHGVPTSLPWGLVFSPWSPAGKEFPGIPLHPTMLYEMALNLGIFAYLWLTRKRLAKDGYTTMRYLLLYSVGRFWVEFLRGDSLMFGSFRVAQLVSVIVIVVCSTLILTWRLYLPELTSHKPSR